MQQILEYLFKSIVIDESVLAVEKVESDIPQTETYNVSVSKDEIGRVIGKGGSVIKAIRLTAGIAAKNQGIYLRLNLLEV